MQLWQITPQLWWGEAAQAGTPRTWPPRSLPPLLPGLHLSTSEKIFRFQDTGLLLRVLGSLFLGGILAFGLGFSEFLLVSRTSSLTLSIAGIFKVQSWRRPQSCLRGEPLSGGCPNSCFPEPCGEETEVPVSSGSQSIIITAQSGGGGVAGGGGSPASQMGKQT